MGRAPCTTQDALSCFLASLLIPHGFKLSGNIARQCGAFQPSPQSFIRLCSATLDLGRAQRRPPGFPDLGLSQNAKGQAELQCAHYTGPYSQEEGPCVWQGEEDLPQH